MHPRCEPWRAEGAGEESLVALGPDVFPQEKYKAIRKGVSHWGA